MVEKETMKGFIIVAWVVSMVLLACLPFAYWDMGWFGVGVIIIGGSMPIGSAVTGIYYWKRGLLDDPKAQRTILM